MHISLGELARRCGCELSGDPDTPIVGAASLESARPGSLVYAVDAKTLGRARASQASAVLAPEGSEITDRPCLLSANVRLSWGRALAILYPSAPPDPSIHPTAIIHPKAVIPASVEIGPYCCIGDGTVLGERVRLYPGVIIGSGVTIGDDSILHPHVVIGDRCIIGARAILWPAAVIGRDGFGMAFDGQRFHRVPQIGIVRIGDDVEIGAHSAVDRAALDETVIEDGVKIDNLVQVAHNVRIGAHSVIASHVGIAGSTRLGSHVVVGGQAGFADNIHVGSGVQIAGQSGVLRDVPAGSIMMGFPARPRKEYLKANAALYRLPAVLERLEAWWNRRESQPLASQSADAVGDLE